MKTRLTYLILAVAAILLPSCVMTEVTREPISFTPVASKATRAIISGTAYPQTESFVVSAYHNDTDPYFTNLTAEYSALLNLWATSSIQYWPLGGSLTFRAYSPSSLSGVTIDATDGVESTAYTIQTEDAMTTDFCYATATVADCATHPESVPLTFSHALTQVVFRVTAAGYYNDVDRTVNLSMTSLSMSGIKSVGDFAEGTWSNQDSEHTYTLSNATTALTYNAEHVPDTVTLCSYLMIPQTLGANAALNVGYSIAETVNSTNFTLENPPVSVALGSPISAWQPGRKYIYTLSIGLNNLITFTATADTWQSGEGGIVVE